MIETIENKFHELTASEMKVANYILDNQENVLNMNIYQLAQEIGVSVASVTRFSKKVFNCNFADAKVKMAKSYVDNSRNIYNLEWDTDFANLPTYLLSCIDSGLKNAIENNSLETLNKAIDLLANARTIYVYGIGNSGIVAQDFVQKMIKIRKKTIYSIENNYAAINSLTSGKDDVIVAISNSGKTAQVTVPVEIAKKNGSKVLSLTSTTRCKLVKMLDENDVSLISPTEQRDNGHRLGPVISRFGQLFLLDILFIGLSQKMYDDPTEFIDSYRNILKIFKL